MFEPIVVTAILDDDHGLIVLNPDVDPVGHDVDLVHLDADLYLCDICDVLSSEMMMMMMMMMMSISMCLMD